MSSFLDPSRSSRPPPPLTPRLVAQRLGLDKKHSRKTVERMLQRGEFPGAFKVGRQWRIPCAALEAYVQKSAARAEEEARARREAVSLRVPSSPLESQESRRNRGRAVAGARK